MNGVAISFAEHRFEARASGALWWPERKLLCVSDLHLGRSIRFARRGGGLIPPYETIATLERLRAEVEYLSPAHVVALGDSFDDDASAGELDADATQALLRMMAGRRWTWIAGNHDPAPIGLPGAALDRLIVDGIAFRHEPAPSADPPQIVGHFHPAVRLKGLRRPAFLVGANCMILPAFGAYTGGLDAHDPALRAVMPGECLAVLTGPRALPVPLRNGRAQM